MAPRQASHSRETETLRHCEAAEAAATLKDSLISQQHQDVKHVGLDPNVNSHVTDLEVHTAQLRVCKRPADRQCWFMRTSRNLKCQESCSRQRKINLILPLGVVHRDDSSSLLSLFIIQQFSFHWHHTDSNYKPKQDPT